MSGLLSNITTAPKSGGVYCLTNLLNGKTYVGQTSNIRNRLKQHRKASNSAVTSLAVQAVGSNNFRWEVLLLSEDIDARYDAEVRWISDKDSIANGYNIAVGGRGAAGVVCTDDRKEASRVFMTGRPVSEETREKHRIASTGFRHSTETKQKLAARRVNVPLPETTKLKMSKSRLGTLNPKARSVRLSLPGLTLVAGTVQELSDLTGISRGTLTNWLRLGVPEGMLVSVDGRVVKTAFKLPFADRDLNVLKYVD